MFLYFCLIRHEKKHIVKLLCLIAIWPFTLNAQRAIKYTTENGLNSNKVYDLHFDSFGRLLISTDIGLNLLNGSKIYKIPEFSHYSFLKFFHTDSSLFCASFRNSFVEITEDTIIKASARNGKKLDLFTFNRIRGVIKVNSSLYLSTSTLLSLKNNKLDTIYTNTTQEDLKSVYFNVFYRKGIHGYCYIHNTVKALDTFKELEVLNMGFDRDAFPHLTHTFHSPHHYFANTHSVYSSSGMKWEFDFLGSSAQITALHIIKNILFIGTRNGDLYSYD